ncbi:hypothetical protein GPECTOR_64g101 [Gonium pectorale]|uniref:phytol kinase n=1 Tax=Gonium pectorale TaxID=33097 RepID=A0A150G424_GONPE|nr:hypothetical protein GPECTOR_64g101 [Gonium pectorale]|eukprot:KXZ44607.1 hypothetical protein GPECTOR_64g101 [Gonium pectorale]
MSSRRSRPAGDGSGNGRAGPDLIPSKIRDALERLSGTIAPLFAGRPGSAVCGPAQGPLLRLLAATLRLRPRELVGQGARQELLQEIAALGVFAIASALRPPKTIAGRRLACSFLLALLRSKALHAASRQLAEMLRELRTELVAALEDSWALEHAARAMFLRTCDAVLLRVLVPTTAVTATIAYSSLCDLHAHWSGPRAGANGEALAARLRAVASGRCVQHAARCFGLATLCGVDGGSAYGLPGELLAVLPSGQGATHVWATAGNSFGAATGPLMTMVRMLQLADPAPPGRRGALALALRVGWLAVAQTAGQAGDGGGGSGGGGASPPAAEEAVGPRRSVPQRDVFPLAAEALNAAWCYLSLPMAVEPAASGAAVVEAAGWWRLLAAVMDRAVPCSAADDGRLSPAWLGACLAKAWRFLPDCDVLCLPAEPPPTLSAALDGGLLRCLELLMRRAGREPQGPEAAVLQELLGRDRRLQSVWSYLAPLLAYGEPRQAAALVATLRKLLRMADSRAPGAEVLAPTPNCDADIFPAMVADFLTTVEEQEAAHAAPAHEPPSPASQQLLRLLSCAACEWLPELSQSLSQTLSSGGAASPGRLSALLPWLLLLAGRCGVRRWAAADVGLPRSDAYGEAGGGGEAAGYSGWRALLLEEVGAVPLLGASLRAMPRLAELPRESRLPLLRSIVAACCAVAAVARGRHWPPAAAAAGRLEQQELGDAAAAVLRQGVLEGSAVRAPAAASAAAAPSGIAAAGTPATPPLPWQPGLLREAATCLRSCGDQDMAAQAEALAAYLELGGDGACEPTRQVPPPPGPLVSALPPPNEARRLLPGRCANPSCANLEGDSEADLTLKACAGCGAVGYCCRLCQTAHWRAGHKRACVRPGGEGAR